MYNAQDIAYVGITGNLKRRMKEHLVNRDSSITTGTSAAVLNPDYVKKVQWWEHQDFTKKHVCQAAELVAFDVLDPVLRSRGKTSKQAKQLYADENFRKKMRSFLLGNPTGCLIIPTLQNALERIAKLEQRVATLEKQSTGK